MNPANDKTLFTDRVFASLTELSTRPNRGLTATEIANWGTRCGGTVGPIRLAMDILAAAGKVVVQRKVEPRFGNCSVTVERVYYKPTGGNNL